jgi:ammonia channel protein AmtB
MQPVDMPGHNASFAILGVFILWFGWYDFDRLHLESCSCAECAPLRFSAACGASCSHAVKAPYSGDCTHRAPDRVMRLA